MKTIPKMVDMRKTPAEMADDYTLPSPSDGPNYPYGLCISLTEDELDKLDVDEVEVGSIVHLHCLGVVTSSSQPINGDRRVEIQITNIEVEDEDEENDEAEDFMDKLYSNS